MKKNPYFHNQRLSLCSHFHKQFNHSVVLSCFSKATTSQNQCSHFKFCMLTFLFHLYDEAWSGCLNSLFTLHYLIIPYSLFCSYNPTNLMAQSYFSKIFCFGLLLFHEYFVINHFFQLQCQPCGGYRWH